MRTMTRLAIVGASIAMLSTAALVSLPGSADAVGPSVTIPAGPFVGGHNINVSGSNFPSRSSDPTGLSIIECSDPGGTPANLPTDATGCEGTTQKTVFQDNTGSFTTTYAPVILNPGNSSINCDQTHYCVLWVGVDYNNDFNGAATHAFSSSFLINPAVAPSITSANNASFPAGHLTTFTVTTTGAPQPSISESGTLPSGVKFHDNGNGTATLSGTPGSAGIFPIQFTAANGTPPNAVQSFTLYAGFVIKTTSLPNAVRGHAYSVTIQAVGGVAPYTFKLVAGKLPAGLTLTATTGKIAGTPKTTNKPGPYAITVTATDHHKPTAQTTPPQKLTINLS